MLKITSLFCLFNLGLAEKHTRQLEDGNSKISAEDSSAGRTPGNSSLVGVDEQRDAKALWRSAATKMNAAHAFKKAGAGHHHHLHHAVNVEETTDADHDLHQHHAQIARVQRDAIDAVINNNLYFYVRIKCENKLDDFIRNIEGLKAKSAAAELAMLDPMSPRYGQKLDQYHHAETRRDNTLRFCHIVNALDREKACELKDGLRGLSTADQNAVQQAVVNTVMGPEMELVPAANIGGIMQNSITEELEKNKRQKATARWHKAGHDVIAEQRVLKAFSDIKEARVNARARLHKAGHDVIAEQNVINAFSDAKEAANARARWHKAGNTVIAANRFATLTAADVVINQMNQPDEPAFTYEFQGYDMDNFGDPELFGAPMRFIFDIKFLGHKTGERLTVDYDRMKTIYYKSRARGAEGGPDPWAQKDGIGGQTLEPLLGVNNHYYGEGSGKWNYHGAKKTALENYLHNHPDAVTDVVETVREVGNGSEDLDKVEMRIVNREARRIVAEDEEKARDEMRMSPAAANARFTEAREGGVLNSDTAMP